MNAEILSKRIEFVHDAMIWIDTADWWRDNKQSTLSSWLENANIKRPSENFNWCSLFIIEVANNANLLEKVDLAARSWLRVGKRTKQPNFGDLAIFWRESKTSWKGHVGIFIGVKDNNYLILGGNQRNRVEISVFSKMRLIDFVDITSFLP